MERLSRLLADYWPGCSGARRLKAERKARELQQEEEERRQRRLNSCRCAFVLHARKYYGVLVKALYGEEKCVSSVIVFNILFWGFMALEVRGIIAASSAALALAIAYGRLENSDDLEFIARMSQSVAQLEKLMRDVKWLWEYGREVHQEQPRACSVMLLSVVLITWFIARTLGSVLFAYVVCMLILLAPAIVHRFCSDELIGRVEWDSGIEEFLPAVTEDNLQVLKRAGETGDRSPTPPSSGSDPSPDHFDEELAGLKMPAHDDGSTDGLELSELEFSSITNIVGIRFKSAHFHPDGDLSSSSEDEVDLRLNQTRLTDIDDDVDDSEDSDDSEFEIIDSRELANLKNV